MFDFGSRFGLKKSGPSRRSWWYQIHGYNYFLHQDMSVFGKSLKSTLCTRISRLCGTVETWNWWQTTRLYSAYNFASHSKTTALQLQRRNRQKPRFMKKVDFWKIESRKQSRFPQKSWFSHMHQGVSYNILQNDFRIVLSFWLFCFSI
jgi:hypothetical protein